MLLGVRAVIAESFERIHRANLVGMGVAPIQYLAGQNAASLGMTGREQFTIDGLDDSVEPGSTLNVTAVSDDGRRTEFKATLRIDTAIEAEYYRNGGLLPYVLRQMIADAI